MQRVVIVNTHDHLAKGLSNEQLEQLLSGLNADMMLEPTTLEDIELTHLPDSLVNSSDDILLSAITTRRLRLDRTMKALIKVLNTQLGSGELTAGAAPDLELASPGAKVIGGAIIGKPRKSGLIATMTAEIPVSDGQSVFIIFHAPDDDPGVIGPDDTLIAFRFLLNKRDITDIVAPHNGRDISLKQTTLALANAIEKNSRKFQAGLKVRQQQAQELETAQAKVDDSVARTAEYVETALQLREQAEKKTQDVEAVSDRLESQLKINAQLERDLEQARARADANAQSNVIQMPGKNGPAINPVEVSDAVKPEDAPAESEPAAAASYEQKYSGNYTGDKYQAYKALPLTEITKKIRLAITEGKRSGIFPAELRVSVTTAGKDHINMEVQALPDNFNVYSSKYVEQYVISGGYPTGIDRYSGEFSSLEARLLDEANQYNKNATDSIADSYSTRFLTFVVLNSKLDSASLARQAEQYKAQAEKAAQEKAQSIEPLPTPDSNRDGSEMKPIQLEDTPESLAALGQAEITSIGDENIYMLKDGLHYYAKVLRTDAYRVGLWDFTKTEEENLAATAEPETVPAEENQPDDNAPAAIEPEPTQNLPADEPAPEDNGQTAEQAQAEAEAAAAEPLDIPAEATTEPEAVPAEEDAPAAPADSGISPEILAVQREIDAMRSAQDRMKKANAYVRSYVKAAEKDADAARAELLTKMAEIGFSEATVNEMLKPNYMGRVVAFEPWELTNLNARIKGREERIKELERREEDAADGDFEYDYTINGAPVTVELDLDADRIRVSFPRLTGKAKESDPEFDMVEKIKGGANWSPSNRAWQRKITTNAKAAVAYALGFKNWSDLVAQGKLAQQEAATLEAAEIEQPEAAEADPAPVENAAPALPAIDALTGAVESETDADKLMDMLDAALSELDATGVDQAEHAALIEQASNRITELLEAA